MFVIAFWPRLLICRILRLLVTKPELFSCRPCKYTPMPNSEVSVIVAVANGVPNLQDVGAQWLDVAKIGFKHVRYGSILNDRLSSTLLSGSLFC